MQTPEADLRALMLAGLAGDAAAYRLLLETLQKQLEGYFRRRLGGDPSEADDLVQESLIAIHTRRGTYDRSQLFTAWAYAIARHKLIDHFRRRGRAAMVPVEDSGLFVSDDSSSVESRLDVERGLASLPPATRALIHDIKLRELSNAEAAAARGMSETAVKVAVHRGLKKLAAFLRTEPEKRP
ncbi:MAG TPA: sigma-70 family RNA polymerase sigma factor [Rhizomicrobium sp.]|nr:sigma-70 family RNA polymerase sigma factor [Rhizomicrobium sp.]